ncbi:MAG TPA: putative LPS assembly protein LptD, partial [Bacteroidales bacterium]|nr:putative LPS assembly protein LptD [Bacteroidales bacterium]
MPTFIYAQVRNETPGNKKDLTPVENTVNDSVPANDTIIKVPRPENAIDTKVIYSATDSIVLSRDSKKVYLYKDAKVEYGEIILQADYIEYNQEENYVYATGVLDSLGNLVGKPVFKENNEEFKARTIKYNFKTKKGYIEDVFTEEEQGFLHSEQTKKLEDNSFLLKNGKYTTCENEDHPHFYLSMTQAKVIPNDKIVSGPAYIVIHDIPIKFLGVPFGFFPNQKEYSSGIIIPKYGEEKNRGFFLQNGGYYFGISDKMDLAITGNIFSKGSWGSDVKFRYKKRYKFTSDFSFTYAEFIKSELGLPDYTKSKDMAIRWTHMQDPKANPNSKFSASVNYSTSSYDQFNSQTIDQRATNTKSSSISYGKSWPGRPFRFNMDLRHSQNSNTNNVTLTLPVMTFNVDRQYPFRKKNASGEMKWYENIELQYSSKAENRISTADSLLFNDTKFSDFQNGFQHQVPISTNFKILKYFNLSPRVEYTGILYPSMMKYGYEQTTNTNGDTIYVLTQDTVPTIKYAQIIKPSISLSVGPNIYGFYNFRNPEAKIQRIRHVVTPSVSVSYVPDLGSMVNQYYFTDT